MAKNFSSVLADQVGVQFSCYLYRLCSSHFFVTAHRYECCNHVSCITRFLLHFFISSFESLSSWAWQHHLNLWTNSRTYRYSSCRETQRGVCASAGRLSSTRRCPSFAYCNKKHSSSLCWCLFCFNFHSLGYCWFSCCSQGPQRTNHRCIRIKGMCKTCSRWVSSVMILKHFILCTIIFHSRYKEVRAMSRAYNVLLAANCKSQEQVM